MDAAATEGQACACKTSPDLVDSIKDIHDILVAVAQASGIRVPQKLIKHALSRPKENPNELSAALEYIVKTLPPDDILQRTVDWIKAEAAERGLPNRQDESRWSGKPPRREPYDLSKGSGQKSLFSWGDKRSVDDAGQVERNTIELSEYGYDENGNLCLLGEYGGHSWPDGGRPFGAEDHDKPPVVEHIFIAPEGTKPAWKGQKFGKEWLLSCGDTLDAEQLAVVFSQVSIHEVPRNTYLTYYPPGLDHLNSETAASNMAQSIIVQFARHFGPAHSRVFGETRFRWLATGLEEHGQQVCIAVYNMRVITVKSQRRVSQGAWDTALDRTRGILRAPTTDFELQITEKRFSTVLKTTTGWELPVFTIVNLSDALETYNLAPLAGDWEAAGVQSFAGLAGYAAFAYRIRFLSELWAKEWALTLNDLDSLLQVDLATVLSHNARMRLMIDDVGSGFALSEFYFAALQFLRIASEWVQEANDNLQELVLGLKKSFIPPVSPPDFNEAATIAFNQTWENVLAHQQHLAKPLLARIARKQAELNSLKDGLFNATSVSEANRSTRLNHYIMVFTVVTIFYLPLSFVAALFALGLFSWDDPGQKGAFIATSVAVAVGTYCFSGLLIWVVGRSRAARQQFFRRVVRWVLTLLDRVGLDVELEDDHWLVGWLDPDAAA